MGWAISAVLVAFILWRVVRVLRQLGEACARIEQARQDLDEL
jgi:hypothetical protein